MEKFLLTLGETRKTEYLLNSFLDSFGFFIVNIHQSAIDFPAPQICIILCVYYVAVYSKGGAYKNQIQMKILPKMTWLTNVPCFWALNIFWLPKI